MTCQTTHLFISTAAIQFDRPCETLWLYKSERARSWAGCGEQTGQQPSCSEACVSADGGRCGHLLAHLTRGQVGTDQPGPWEFSQKGKNGGTDLLWGYSLHGRSRNWCQFQGYGDFSQTHDALPRLLEVQTRPDRRVTGQLAPGRWP